MISRRAIGGLFLGAAVLAIGGCGAAEPDAIFRYRMTVEVETPDGVRTGSVVRELKLFDRGRGPSSGESKPRVDLIGEAVVVDLRNGTALFALLTSADGDVDYAARIADRTRLWNVKKPMPKGSTIGLWPIAPVNDGLANTNPLPMLVTFKDLADPTSVARVDPAKLEASFGPGYRLKAITVQVTDEPVTVGIEKRLGWLEAVGRERATLIPNPPKYLDEIRDPAQRVNPGDFTTELYK